MEHMIDIHCHILPNLDDGPKTTEESLTALKCAAEQGFSKIILTPHHYPDKIYSPQEIYDKTNMLQKYANELGLNIELFPGQECLFHSGLPALLESGDVLTLAGSKYVLVEFLENVRYRELLWGLSKLREAGYVPILAHYERYRCLLTEDRVENLKYKNILLQMNFETIQHKCGWRKTTPFHKHILKGYVDYFGSDCHGMSVHKHSVQASLKWLEQHLSQKELKKILITNPRKIVGQIY